jgi:alkylated DNA nucleotide flippase Atl1
MLPGTDAQTGACGRPDFVRRVLDLVASIPPGRVLTYGDVAHLLESGGPRQVGAVMSRHGSGVPWWRVVNASGMLPPSLRGEAAANYARESTPYDIDRERVGLSAARWDGR